MEVKVAKTAGFCYGVERAVNAVYRELSRGCGRIYTYGPIVHNDLVVQDLREKGVYVIESIEELRRKKEAGELADACVVIRAHGVGREVYELLGVKGGTFGKEPGAEEGPCGLRLIDATCPHVAKIHEIVREHHAAGEQIVVTGSRVHPEVIGILGQIGGDAIVIENAGEAEKAEFPGGKTICIVSQTTFHVQKFEDIVAIFRKKQYNVNVINTICNATQMRQKEAARLAKECDAMIVIGGRSSSNTAKLFEICRSECRETFFIQSAEDLDDTFNTVRCVGITAGASTPKSIIEEVLRICQR